jgi:hypothetical protein
MLKFLKVLFNSVLNVSCRLACILSGITEHKLQETAPTY